MVLLGKRPSPRHICSYPVAWAQKIPPAVSSPALPGDDRSVCPTRTGNAPRSCGLWLLLQPHQPAAPTFGAAARRPQERQIIKLAPWAPSVQRCHSWIKVCMQKNPVSGGVEAVFSSSVSRSPSFWTLSYIIYVGKNRNVL